jgi:hypothetical protein
MTTTTSKSSLNNRLLMTISLAIPAILVAGSAAQAESVPSSSSASASKPVGQALPPSKIDVNQFNRFGCPACRSARDTRFNDRVNPPVIVNPVTAKPAVR